MQNGQCKSAEVQPLTTPSETTSTAAMATGGGIALSIILPLLLLWIWGRSYACYKEHMRNLYAPLLQRCSIRIIMSICAFSAFLLAGFYLPEYTLVFQIFQYFFEGYLLYCFFGMLVLFVNGEDGCVGAIEYQYENGTAKWVDKLLCPGAYCCFSSPRTYFRVLQLMVGQLMVVKPLANTGVLLYAASTHRMHNLNDELLRVHFVSIASLVLAYMALTRFYMAVRHRLEPLHIVWPFLIVKGLILLLTVEGTAMTYVGEKSSPSAALDLEGGESPQDRAYRLYAVVGLLEVALLIHPIALAFSYRMFGRVAHHYPDSCVYINSTPRSSRGELARVLALHRVMEDSRQEEDLLFQPILRNQQSAHF